MQGIVRYLQIFLDRSRQIDSDIHLDIYLDRYTSIQRYTPIQRYISRYLQIDLSNLQIDLDRQIAMYISLKSTTQLLHRGPGPLLLFIGICLFKTVCGRIRPPLFYIEHMTHLAGFSAYMTHLADFQMPKQALEYERCVNRHSYLLPGQRYISAVSTSAYLGIYQYDAKECSTGPVHIGPLSAYFRTCKTTSTGSSGQQACLLNRLNRHSEGLQTCLWAL